MKNDGDLGCEIFIDDDIRLKTWPFISIFHVKYSITNYYIISYEILKGMSFSM